MINQQAKDARSFNRYLDEYERQVVEIPRLIDRCSTEAEAVEVIKRWLCDDLDFDNVVAAWERKATQRA